jgi:hypothetical protein
MWEFCFKRRARFTPTLLVASSTVTMGSLGGGGQINEVRRRYKMGLVSILRVIFDLKKNILTEILIHE